MLTGLTECSLMMESVSSMSVCSEKITRIMVQVRIIKRLFVEQFLAFVAGHVQDRISNNELAVTQSPIETEANLAFGRLFIGFWRRQSTEVSRFGKLMKWSVLNKKVGY